MLLGAENYIETVMSIVTVFFLLFLYATDIALSYLKLYIQYLFY